MYPKSVLYERAIKAKAITQKRDNHYGNSLDARDRRRKFHLLSL